MNKKNWSFDGKTNEYTFDGAYVLYGLNDEQLRLLFRKHLKKEMVSLKKYSTEIGGCDCYAICYCKKKHVIKFAD